MQNKDKTTTSIISRRAFLATASAAAAGCTTMQSTNAKKTATTLALPPLPYAANALEPLISAQTISFHYGKHHQGYFNNLLKLLPDSPFATASLEEIVRGSSLAADHTAIFNNAAQVWNHTFYWDSLCAAAQVANCSPALTHAINDEFGSIEGCRNALQEAAVSQFGSGWAWLVAKGHQLSVVKTANADTPLRLPGVVPLLTVDVWEHAYYLDWQNRRADYVKMLLSSHINWHKVSERYSQALRV